jgi:hypothetical protein
MHGWGTDTRQALRRLRRTPGFTLFAIAALAIGIGATSAIFSLAYAIWLKPLPYGAPDRLVSLRDVDENGASASVSGPESEDYRRNGSTSSSIRTPTVTLASASSSSGGRTTCTWCRSLRTSTQCS